MAKASFFSHCSGCTVLLLLTLAGCSGGAATPATETAVLTPTGSSSSFTSAGGLSFVGLASATVLTGSSVALNWSAYSGTAASYLVFTFHAGTGSLVSMTPVSAVTLSTSVVGLSPATTYRFRVRVVDTTGAIDTNTNDQTATTASVAAPDAIAGLSLWLKSDVGVSVDGSNRVSDWADQSAAANHLTQATSGFQPLLALNQINGLPLLQLDGSRWMLRSNADTSMNHSAVTLFAAFRTTGAGSSYRALYSKQSAYGMYLQDNILCVYDWSNAQTITRGGALNDGNLHIVAFVFQSGVAGTAKLYIDGVQSGAAFTYTVASQSSRGTLSAGEDSGAMQQLTGDLGEVLVYGNALSDIDRDTVFTYLADRWQ